MTTLLVIGAIAAFIVLLVVWNEIWIARRDRRRPRVSVGVTGHPRAPHRDVVVFDWSEPEGRSRLGRLGQ